jgi:hypothetical protein
MFTSRKTSIEMKANVKHRARSSALSSEVSLRHSTFGVRCSMFGTRVASRLCALPHDERGTISVMSVITIFALTLVLGMVINAGRQVDDKIRLQNAADAAAYSGGAVMARGFNALAFSNHLEAEVFALVAYMRAGRDAGPSKDPTTLNFENSILDAWNVVGGIFSKSSFPKFAKVGPAIQQKVPLEKDIVKYFLQMTELQSSLVLSPLESILRGPVSQPGGSPDPLGGVIPRFQRSVVLTTPQTAQLAASEIARLHGSMTTTGKLSGLEKQHGRQPLTAVLWRTNAMPISAGNEQDPQMRTMPVFDPSPTGPDASMSTIDYLELSRCQRRRWATYVMALWNQYLLDPFYRGIPNPGPGGATSAKMSALYWIWTIYTCGQLNKLLDQEYYATNVPHVYAVPNNAFNGAAGSCQPQPAVYDCNCLEIGNLQFPGYRRLMYQNVDPQQASQQPTHLDQYQTFVAVVYWPRLSQTSPPFYRYPLASDAMAFAQVSVFVPKARYVIFAPWLPPGPPWLHQSGTDQSGSPIYANNYDRWPQDWDSLYQRWTPIWDITNQNWVAKLSPATSDSVVMILQSPLAQQFAPNVRTPSLGGLSPYGMRQINTH